LIGILFKERLEGNIFRKGSEFGESLRGETTTVTSSGESTRNIIEDYGLMKDLLKNFLPQNFKLDKLQAIKTLNKPQEGFYSNIIVTFNEYTCIY
jgi:hypothetical protein